MKIYKFPTTEQLREIITRPTKDAVDLTAVVSAVLARIKSEGDAAVLDYEQQFDKVDLRCLGGSATATGISPLTVTQAEFDAADALVSP